MNKIWLTGFLCLVFLGTNAQSPYVSKIIEYKPAPGQFVNTDAWGKPAKANSLIGGINGGISLGGFGGYIILGFDHRIENHPDNPYGIDFTVFGNPLATNGKVSWSEAGAVMVMKDVNGNGLADDTWYELAGSDYYFNSTVRNYAITYVNPKQSFAANVPWTDNTDQSGNVLKNDFHLQSYYPLTASFPNVNQDQETYTGNKIKGYVDRSREDLIQSYKRGFGYADNGLAGGTNYTIPDNPYTKAIEGSGGDAFDIDWTIDENGNHINLDGIDFIKVYTALNEDAGWLGEVSTEVRGAVDVAPNSSITGVLDYVVLADLPVKVRTNTQFELEAYAFFKGIHQSTKEILFTVDNLEAAEIDNKILTTKADGTITITASLAENPSITDRLIIDIVTPQKIRLNIAATSMRMNAQLEVSSKIFDKKDLEIKGIETTWTSSDDSRMSIVTQEGKTLIQAKAVGSAWLKVEATHVGNLKDSIEINILPEAETRFVYLTIKDEGDIIIPRKKIAVKNFDLNSYLDPVSTKYGIDKITEVTAAHAIAQLFKNESFESDLRFRDDNKSAGKLYLWRIPKGDNTNVSYVYGYGGTIQSSFSKSWLIKVNQRTYVNNIDKIPISENDEITVFHVPDVSKPWKLIDLRIDKDTVDIDEPVTITAQSFSQALDGSGNVVTTNSDYLGQTTTSFTNDGWNEIVIEGAKITVFVRSSIVTGIDEKENREIIYPNPFIDVIHVPLGDYEIYDLTGRLRIKGNGLTIDASLLSQGVYMLRINSRTIKIIKK